MKTNLTVQDYKSAMKVMIAYKHYGAVVDFLRDDLEVLEITLAEQAELDKWENVLLHDCPDMETFLSWAEETLDEELREETPHGECGGDISGYFRWNDKEWLVTYEPDWNRHDKQYYYIDNWGGDHTTAVEITKEGA